MPKAIEVGTGARWLRPRRHAFEQATYNLDEALLVRRAVDHEFLKSFRRIERHVLTAFTRVSNLPPGRLKTMFDRIPVGLRGDDDSPVP